MAKIVLVINGPNLNMLGKREPAIYGSTTLDDINSGLEKMGKEKGLVIESFQSNHEGAIVDRIHEAFKKVDGIIINPGAYTHTSVAIRDALLILDVPIIEVHISNVHKREEFRHHSYISDISTGQIVGLGVKGYYLALEAMSEMLA